MSSFTFAVAVANLTKKVENQGDEPIRTLNNGVSITDDITISLPDDENYYTLYDEQGQEILVNFEPIVLDSVVITVLRTKEQKEVKINGRDNPVIIQKSNGKRKVTFRATVFGELEKYPYNKAKVLESLSQIPQSVKVTCKYLNKVHGIDYLNIKTCRTAKDASAINSATFDFTADTTDNIKSNVLFVNGNNIEYGSY